MLKGNPAGHYGLFLAEPLCAIPTTIKWIIIEMPAQDLHHFAFDLAIVADFRKHLIDINH